MPRTTKPRPSLALLPTLHHVAPDRDAYLSYNVLRKYVPKAKRYWSFHGVPTTVELDGRRFAKSAANFPDHQDERVFGDLIREYTELGVPRPSGYADPFHAAYASPRVPYSIAVDLGPAFAGGWQAALAVGVHHGVHYKYDMRSAYLWAGSLGLPDARTYRYASFIGTEPGVFRVRLERPVPGAPYPFDRRCDVLATNDEIELYSLPVAEVLTGVTWRRDLDPAKMLEAIYRASTWKQAGRSYWGRWGQTERVYCHAGAKAWQLPSLTVNIPYAHLIVSRVRAKLWTAAAKAVHVFVDSVITPQRIAIGPGIGDWKLEATYPRGVQVRGPGWYGEPGKRLERAAGVPSSSPLRDRWADAEPELLAG